MLAGCQGHHIATNISDVCTPMFKDPLLSKYFYFFLDDNSWMHWGDFECDKVLVGGNGVDVVDVVAAHMAM